MRRPDPQEARERRGRQLTEAEGANTLDPRQCPEPRRGNLPSRRLLDDHGGQGVGERFAVVRLGTRERAIQGLREVGDEVVGVFDAHGVADQVVLDPDLQALLGGQLVEAHDGGLLDERLDATE